MESELQELVLITFDKPELQAEADFNQILSLIKMYSL